MSPVVVGNVRIEQHCPHTVRLTYHSAAANPMALLSATGLRQLAAELTRAAAELERTAPSGAR